MGNMKGQGVLSSIHTWIHFRLVLVVIPQHIYTGIETWSIAFNALATYNGSMFYLKLHGAIYWLGSSESVENSEMPNAGLSVGCTLHCHKIPPTSPPPPLLPHWGKYLLRSGLGHEAFLFLKGGTRRHFLSFFFFFFSFFFFYTDLTFFLFNLRLCSSDLF